LKKTVEHIIPNIEDWPISQFGEKRGDFVADLNAFVLKEIVENHGSDLEPLLAKTIYLEKRRSKNNKSVSSTDMTKKLLAPLSLKPSSLPTRYSM